MYDSSSLSSTTKDSHSLKNVRSASFKETKPAVLIWSVLARSIVATWEYHIEDGIICILSGGFPVGSICNTTEADFGAASVR